VKDQEYPWIGGYYSNGKIRCGGNLSKIFLLNFYIVCKFLLMSLFKFSPLYHLTWDNSDRPISEFSNEELVEFKMLYINL
jgi:hypothetical protein